MRFCVAILSWLSYGDKDHDIICFFVLMIHHVLCCIPPHLPPMPPHRPNQNSMLEIIKKNHLYGLFSGETCTRGFSTERTEGSVTCSTFTL